MAKDSDLRFPFHRNKHPMRNSMNKKKLIERLSQKTILSKKQAEQFLTHFTAIIMETLKEGRSVTLTPFGKFYTRQRGRRNGRHPKSGERIPVESVRVAGFRPGEWLRNNLES